MKEDGDEDEEEEEQEEQEGGEEEEEKYVNTDYLHGLIKYRILKGNNLC